MGVAGRAGLLLSTASAGRTLLCRYGGTEALGGERSLPALISLCLRNGLRPLPFRWALRPGPSIRGLCFEPGHEWRRGRGLSPREGCPKSRLQGPGAAECPLLTLPLRPPGRSSDTYRVSRVPRFPTVSSITHGALNDKENSKCGTRGTGAICHRPGELTAASPLPSSFPHTAGGRAPLRPWSKGWELAQTYPISRGPRGPLGLAVLALLPLWTQKQL